MSGMGRREFLRSFLGRSDSTQHGTVPHDDKDTRDALAVTAPSSAEPSPLRMLAETYSMAHKAAFGEAPVVSPDYEALLPPEFTPALLKLEAIRLGLDPDTLSRRELAHEVLRHMGALPE